MRNPIEDYSYRLIASMSYDDWAEAAYQAERVPVLPLDKADRLRAIYAYDGEYTSSMHHDNLNWLGKLQQELNYVWSTPQRNASGMSHLVGDYKETFSLQAVAFL